MATPEQTQRRGSKQGWETWHDIETDEVVADMIGDTPIRELDPKPYGSTAEVIERPHRRLPIDLTAIGI